MTLTLPTWLTLLRIVMIPVLVLVFYLPYSWTNFAAAFIFVLAAVNEVMWRSFTTDTWIASKMFLSFPLTLVFAFLQIPLLKRYWDGDDNPFARGS